MSATKIEWTDDTWNPIRGCSRVSEGCRNCYAEKTAYRYSGPGLPYEGLVRIGADGARRPEWNGQIQFVEKHLLDPLKWGRVKSLCETCGASVSHGGNPNPRHVECYSGRARRIFVNSMSDLFHENVTDAMRDRIFALMALCRQHIFQVLTKRPERMLAYLSDPALWERLVAAMEALHNAGKVKFDALAQALVTGLPLPHVQLGVSVEDQPTANKRIPLLLQTPAAVRFISAEPLLGEINLCEVDRALDDFDRSMPGFSRVVDFYVDWLRGSHSVVMDDCGGWEEPYGTRPKLDWVIVGGESGPGARPMHPHWVRSLRNQCINAGVPFFFKQWGEWEPIQYVDGQDGKRLLNVSLPNETNFKPSHREIVFTCTDVVGYGKSSVNMRRVGKKTAGHLLDGEVLQHFPEVPSHG